MRLKREEVLKIAHLARLVLSEEEISRLETELSNILELDAALDTVNTHQVQPFTHPLQNLSQRLRPDVVTETSQRELFQSIAPQATAGLYLVPEVITDQTPAK